MSFEDILSWRWTFGPLYGSEEKGVFLYSLVKMLKPQRVLELGTGMGVSAFLIAQALKENGKGRLHTVDDASEWPEVFRSADFQDAVRVAPPFIRELFGSLPGAPVPDFFDCMNRAAARMALGSHLSIENGRVPIESTEELTAARYPFLEAALAGGIDMVFVDIGVGPFDCLTVLTQYLPLLAESGSILFDSAPSLFESHIALEQTVAQLNASKLPAVFFAGTTPGQQDRLTALVRRRRFNLVHIMENKNKIKQNGISWLKVEPVNVLPYPLGPQTFMGGRMTQDQTRHLMAKGQRAR
jgi:predicted O-methyltransferase YrrM